MFTVLSLLLSIIAIIITVGFAVASLATKASGAVFAFIVGTLVAQKVTLCETRWFNTLILSILVFAVYYLITLLLPCTKRAFKFFSSYTIATVSYTVAFTLAFQLTLAIFPNVDMEHVLHVTSNVLSVLAIPYAFMLSRDSSYNPCSDNLIVAIIDYVISFGFYFLGLIVLTQFNPMVHATPLVLIGMGVGALILCVMDKVTY